MVSVTGFGLRVHVCVWVWVASNLVVFLLDYRLRLGWHHCDAETILVCARVLISRPRDPFPYLHCICRTLPLVFLCRTTYTKHHSLCFSSRLFAFLSPPYHLNQPLDPPFTMRFQATALAFAASLAIVGAQDLSSVPQCAVCVIRVRIQKFSSNRLLRSHVSLLPSPAPAARSLTSSANAQLARTPSKAL